MSRQRILFWTLNAAERSLHSAADALVKGRLRAVGLALRAGDVSTAVRTVDSAWRQLPDAAEAIAPLYARILLLAGEMEPALHMLRRLPDALRDPELDALLVDTLRALQRQTEAAQTLEAALSRYCLLSDSPLLLAAADFLSEGGVPASGCMGLGIHAIAGGEKTCAQDRSLARDAAMCPEFQFVGLLKPSSSADGVEIVHADGGRTPLLPVLASDGIRYFRGSAAVGDRVQHHAKAGLLGSGIGCPPSFELDGRTWNEGKAIAGWVRIGWMPSAPVKLRVEDARGGACWTCTAKTPDHAWRWPFKLDPRRHGLRGDRFSISASMPDGSLQPLPDSPLLFEPAVRLKDPPRARGRRVPGADQPTARRPSGSAQAAPRPRTVDVIVPVYGGRQETLACLDSVQATMGADAQLIVVDDASDDAVLAAALDRLAASGHITLLRNAENRGYVGSVNRGMALHPGRDVVLLNSDAQVFGDWLARLRAAAYAEDKVGTVTPFTNCGTIASYLPDESPPLTPERACVYHQLAASTHAGVSVDIPVGVGFCLYVRRDCLDAVGLFDEAVFGKGYGEESDFCIRARKTGWRHRFAADVFVYHAGGRSFSSRRLALFDRSQRLLNLRHPGYDATVRRFLAADPLAPLRRTLDERRLKSMDGRFVLLLTLAIPGGGVDRYVGERCRRIRSEGLLPLVLRPAAMGDATRCALWTDALAAHDLRYAVPDEIARLREVLGALAIERVEIQHFLHLDPRVVDMARSIGAPYDVYVHDYAWICPRVTLIGGEGRYCGEPDLAACEACVMENGSNLDERITVAALRRRSTGWLQDARDVFAPTSDTASRLRRYFSRTIEVRPHGPPLAAVAAAMREAVDGTIRVALLGGIGEHKGHRLLLACARDAAARRLPLEYVVIGYTEDDKPLLETGKVFVTGRYSEAEAPHLLRREQPHIAFLASVWPETWSYVLDHAVSAGLPVVAFDLGAIAERLRESGLGTLLPLDSRAGDINDVFLQLSGRAAAIRPNAASALEAPPAARQGAPPPVEFHPPDLSPFRPRTDHYEPKINETMKTANATESASADDALSASLQLLPLPVGLYLFSVKAAVPSATPAMGNITLPAVHVGLGPGVDPRRVEFVAGPATSGPWLFAQGDLLVVKITGSGVAPLVLTSVRAPGGETLSIKIERLEGRNEAATSAPAASVEPEAAKPAASRDRAEEKPRKPTVVARPDELGLPVQIKAHVRARGDMTFSDTPWAGRVGAGMWMESFSVLPLDRFSAADIEYKGLTASGFETPWLSDDAMCGTKGMAIPLIGFAVRLKPSPDTAAYDCEYSGYFQSGTTSGPFRNGAPCRSTVANDPLEGIQIRIVKRKARATGTAGPQAGHGDELASAVGVGEPDLGSYRTLHADDVVHTTSATKSAAGGRPARTSGKAAAKLNSKGKSAGNGNANGGGAGGTMKSAKAGSSSRPAADQRSPRPRSTRPQR